MCMMQSRPNGPAICIIRHQVDFVGFFMQKAFSFSPLILKPFI